MPATVGYYRVEHRADKTELHGFMGIEIRDNTPEGAEQAGWGDGYFGRARIGAYKDKDLRAAYHRAYNKGAMERSYN